MFPIHYSESYLCAYIPVLSLWLMPPPLSVSVQPPKLLLLGIEIPNPLPFHLHSLMILLQKTATISSNLRQKLSIVTGFIACCRACSIGLSLTILYCGCEAHQRRGQFLLTGSASGSLWRRICSEFNLVFGGSRVDRDCRHLLKRRLILFLLTFKMVLSDMKRSYGSH